MILLYNVSNKIHYRGVQLLDTHVAMNFSAQTFLPKFLVINISGGLGWIFHGRVEEMKEAMLGSGGREHQAADTKYKAASHPIFTSGILCVIAVIIRCFVPAWPSLPGPGEKEEEWENAWTWSVQEEHSLYCIQLVRNPF